MFRPIDTGTNNRGRFLLMGFLVALSLIIMISDQLGLLRPVEQVTGTFLNPVENATYHLGQNLSNSSAFFGDLEKLRKENQDLQRKLDEANSNEARIIALADLLDRQDRKAQFANNPLYKDFTNVPADVIRRDTTGQNQTITINRGANDGIKRGKPVLDPSGYLVGRVEKVEASQSVVLLITDNSVAVSIITQRYLNDKKVDIIPADGTAEGQWQNGGRINVLHLNQSADVKSGDWVFTSSQSAFPPNLLVGKLDKVTKEAGQPEQQATLIPIADLDHLQQVQVVISW